MKWLFAAQLFFGLDPTILSAQQAIERLEAQGFRQIAKPNPSPPDASVDRLLDSANVELEWFGFRPYDFRLQPISAKSEIAYIELHPCPSTGKLAEIIIAYNANIPISQFGKMAAEITDSLGFEPETKSSGTSLTVSWRRAAASTVAAHWIKDRPPQIQLLGSRGSISCRLAFGAASGPDD